MFDYITSEDASKIWGISKRRVQILCADGRVEGAIKHSGVWAIPKGSKKPQFLNLRKKDF